MKKTFLDFNKFHYQRRRLPKMNRFIRSACYLTDATEKTAAEKAEEEAMKELPDDTDEIKQVKAIKRIGKQVTNFNTLLGDKADKAAIEGLTKQVADLQKGIETMTAAEVTKMIKEINDGNEKMWKQVVEIQEDLAKKKEEEAGSSNKKKPLVATKDVEEFIKETFKDGKKTNNAAKIELKAAEIIGYSSFFATGSEPTQIDAFTGRFVDPTLYQRKRKRNLILDNFTIRTINVPKLIFLIKVEDGDDAGSVPGDSGGADWITSGEIKPMRSFRVTTGEAEAKKVAIFGTVEDKLLRDVSSLENWIREDFMDEMKEEINDGLLNNDPAVDPDAPLGLKTNAVQFVATPGYANAFVAATTNYIDQIFAAIAFMAYNKEDAGMVFVSSDVFYRIMHLKDNDGRYQNNNLVYTDAIGRLFIGGVEVVKADAEDIDGNNVLVVGADLGFKIYAYGPMVFERGLNGEDFRYDRTSFRGYQEFLSFIPDNRENSVMYDTWANIKAGIEA